MRAATVLQRRRLTRVLPANDDGVPATVQDDGGAAPAFFPVSAALPPQLAFLGSHGLTHAALGQAAELARRWGAPPEQALFAAGLMEPHAYYRALALELGAPFAADALRRGGLRLGGDVSYPESIAAGVAPALDGDGRRLFVLAPRGAMLASLLSGRMEATNAVIVTPEALERAVMRRHAPAIAHDAGHALADARPDLSCREGVSRGQALALAVALPVAALLGALAPAVAAALFAAVFLSHAIVRLAATFAGSANAPGARMVPSLADADLPVFTVIVPVYGEANMAGHIVQSLERLDYPRARLDVKIVVEAEDHATRVAFIALQPPSWISIIVAPPGEPRTKPRALNVALATARGEFTTIYDAEDAPDPDQLRKAVTVFRAASPDIACLQARLAIDNSADGWLPACFALEYAALFDVINPGLARLGLPVPLGGTSNHFRTVALRQVQGWDAWNVTEDADLGLRLARAGWGVADLDSVTLEEAPVQLRAWLAQRTRWLKGWMQVAITHSRAPGQVVRELGCLGAWAAAAQCAGVVLSALGFPLFVLGVAAQLVSGALLSLDGWQARLGAASATAVALAGLVSGVAPLVVGARRRKLAPVLVLAPLLPFYYALVSLAAWRALAEQIRSPARWNKTRHGVARSSRSGRLTYIGGTPSPLRRADASD
ncbi:glycosyltransferase [Camelimonas fluminis]|uniref:Glycosyltransferase n=1 Tax=Camelimonas fluminis TaxID=1576911 RepID=A0ABV7UBK5_9HYPH|nr:glycosyltransferase [Camelimonas fluminis]